MRLAIYGSGGLGGYYGARLAEAGNDVVFIARGAQLAAMRTGGLQVHSPLGDVYLASPQVSEQPAEVAPVDVVLVAVKTWQIDTVAQQMLPLLRDDTLVLPLLNGVEAADLIGQVVGSDKVIGGLSKVFSQIEAPGVIRHLNPHAYIEAGELDGTTSERVGRLIDALQSAGIEAAASKNIRTALWKKLLLVASWSGIATLSRSPIGIVRQDETRALVETSIDEGIAVGRACGYALEQTLKDDMWAFYDALPHDTTSSMQRDMLDQKPSELDAWIGAVVKHGSRHQVPTPVSEFVYHMLLPIERKSRAMQGS